MTNREQKEEELKHKKYIKVTHTIISNQRTKAEQKGEKKI